MDMNSIITPKQMTEYILKTLDDVVQDIPDDKKEAAKSKILESFAAYMFKGPAEEIKK